MSRPESPEPMAEVTAPTSAHHDKESLIGERPPRFLGDKSKWDNFAAAVRDYIVANPEAFHRDEWKIFFVNGLLGSTNNSPSLALTWKRNWAQQNIDPDTFALKANVTFCAYWKTLKSNFSDINEKYNARLRLEAFKQGSLEITDFFSEFEMLADMAGHPLRDPPPVEDEPQSTFVFEIIQAMLEQSINTKLINWMMVTPQYPLMSSYEEIKTLAIYSDAMFKKQHLHKATQGTSNLPTTTTMTTTTTTDKTAPSHRAYTAPVESQGIPIDTSRTQAPDLCYNCLKKGHVPSKTGPSGKKVFTCPDPCKYCGKKQSESGHAGQWCPKNMTPRRGSARVRSTEVEFETPSTATSSATETRFTSLENNMASIKDGQNLLMQHLEEFFKQCKDF